MAKKKKQTDPGLDPGTADQKDTPTTAEAEAQVSPGTVVQQPAAGTPAGHAAEVADQVSQAWTGLLAMATQQGATRRDIVVMTLMTAASVMDITAINLWPLGSDLPPDELQGFGAFQEALGTVSKALQVLQAPVDLQSIRRPSGGSWVWTPDPEA